MLKMLCVSFLSNSFGLLVLYYRAVGLLHVQCAVFILTPTWFKLKKPTPTINSVISLKNSQWHVAQTRLSLGGSVWFFFLWPCASRCIFMCHAAKSSSSSRYTFIWIQACWRANTPAHTNSQVACFIYEWGTCAVYCVPDVCFSSEPEIQLPALWLGKELPPRGGGFCVMKRLLSPPNCTPNPAWTHTYIYMCVYTVADGQHTHALNLITLCRSFFFYGSRDCGLHNKERQRSLINLESSVDLGGYQGGSSLRVIQLGWIPLPSNAVQLQRQGLHCNS